MQRLVAKSDPPLQKKRMKPLSLVLVTVDCLRADHVGFLGYSPSVSPFLDSLAGQSIVFKTVIVAGAPTYFSFPAIMASRHPLALGREVLGIAPGEATIATVLQKSGYKTAAFLAANPYLSSRFGYAQGFNHFEDFLKSELPFSEEKPDGSEMNRRIQALASQTRLSQAAYDELYFWYCQWRSSREEPSVDQLRRYPSADVIVDQASSWLDGSRNEPFFLWIHLMDPHHPYYPPLEALSSIGAGKITTRRARFLNSVWNRGDIDPQRLKRYRADVLSLYDAGIYWADKQIGRLVADLTRLGRADDTVLAVTADHGEEFLEYGARYHSPTSLPEELIRVPLLIRVPSVTARTLSGQFSHLHLAPTLLESVGSVPPESFRGRSRWSEVLSGNLPDEPTVVECLEGCNNPFHAEDRIRSRMLAVRDRNYKLVLSFVDEKEGLFDLRNNAVENSPLPQSAVPKERASLLLIAQAYLQQGRGNRNSHLSLAARLREIEQSIDLKSRQIEHPVSE